MFIFVGFEVCDGGLRASLAMGRGFAELSEESSRCKSVADQLWG